VGVVLKTPKSKLQLSNPAFGRKVDSPLIARAKIFGNRIGDGKHSGWGFWKRPSMAEAFKHYYPPVGNTLKFPDLNISEKQLNNLERTDRRRKRGKPPAKKGAGKAAGKKKKK